VHQADPFLLPFQHSSLNSVWEETRENARKICKEGRLASKEKEIQSLRERVIELDRELAKAQAAIQALTPKPQDSRHTNGDHSYEQILQELKQASAQEKANFLASEERLQSALIMVPHPLMIRRDDGQVMMINAAWAEISGYGLEEIPTIAEWTRKAYGESAPERKSEILDDGFAQNGVKKSGEFEITTRSGEKRIWDFSTAPLGVDQQGRRLTMIMAVDITERKQAEEKLRAARDEATWLARFPNENPNPVIRVSREGMVLYCNTPAASLRGWRCAIDTALSRPLVDLVELAIEQDQVVEQDVSLGDKFYSVSVIPLLKQGYLNLYGRDVTERKLAETALAESERRQREITRLLELDQARLAAILRHLPVGVWIVDEQGRLMGSNPEAERIWAGEVPLDSPADYLNYVSWLPGSEELLSPEEYPITAALRTGEPVQPLELNIRRFDGSQGAVLASAVPIRDGKGGLIGVVAVNVDITERKQAEAHINDLLSLNEKILNHSSIGILTYKVSGQCVFANEKIASIVGTSVAELLKQNFSTIESWKKSGLYDLVQQAIATQAPATADIHHISTFGKDLWMTVHCITFRSKSEDHVLLSISDITERKQVEQALRESEQRLKRAQEIAHLGSWELDLIDNRLTWSDEVYRIFGLQPLEFGASYEAFLVTVHPEDRAAVDNAYSSSIREGRDTYQIEHRVVRHSNGEVRIVHEKCEHFRDQSGQIIRSIGMVHDITERKQAEQALQESETRFRSLADSMPQLVWTALPDGTVDYYNQRYQEYCEIKQVERAAWEWAPVLHPDDRQPTVDAWQRSVETGEIYQIEHRVRMSDGSYRWHLSRGVPVLDETGQIIRWFGTATDIHDLKLAEEQLRVYAERLERSNRELEQFAFMASHDLQEPLRKIEMFGDLLLERATGLDHQGRNCVERMQDASGRMRDMVEGLLQLSRITTQGKPFLPVELSQVTSEVLHDLEGQIRRTNGNVKVEPLPAVEGDGMQLRLLMQNLIGNALKYHQPGIPPEIKVYAEQRSEKVQIHVEDQGIGFAQEDAERIFQPFQRLVGRSQYEGSGMGLAICRRIMERHGGEIAAFSKPGHGTTVIVTFPSQHSGSVTDELGKDASNAESSTTPGG
jgi:PAS domain S-box-containing protein